MRGILVAPRRRLLQLRRAVSAPVATFSLCCFLCWWRLRGAAAVFAAAQERSEGGAARPGLASSQLRPAALGCFLGAHASARGAESCCGARGQRNVLRKGPNYARRAPLRAWSSAKIINVLNPDGRPTRGNYARRRQTRPRAPRARPRGAAGSAPSGGAHRAR